MMYRLNDKHPTMQKLEKLAALADELGITLCFTGHATIIVDKAYPGKDFVMADAENGDAVMEFPYPVEHKITYER